MVEPIEAFKAELQIGALFVPPGNTSEVFEQREVSVVHAGSAQDSLAGAAELQRGSECGRVEPLGLVLG